MNNLRQQLLDAANALNENAGANQRIASELGDVWELLHSEITALRALSGLFNGNTQNDSVCVSELPYLLDPLIERQVAINQQIWVIKKQLHGCY